MKYILTIIFSLALVSPVYASTYSGMVTTGVSTGNSTSVVVKAMPTASPAPSVGPFTSAQTVTLSAPGATSIHYFFNKPVLSNTLTCSSGATTTPVVVATTGLLRAVACYGTTAGPIVNLNYTIGSTSNSGGTTSGSGTGTGGSTSIGGNTTTTYNKADFNDDGKVGILDFNAIITNWGKTSGVTKAMGDANGDGKVNIYDFNILINNWSTA